MRKIYRLLVLELDSSKARKHALQTEEVLRSEVQVSAVARSLVAACDVAIMAIASRKAYFERRSLHAGLHITVVGVEMLGKQESYPDVLTPLISFVAI